ncbi:RNA polymerase sigma factor SigI [Paradesulfitobacterium aromaticivorans]
MPEWEERWPWDRIKTDQDTRETFLHDSQPFVRHVASQACHRLLEWGRDEELSEGFVAFNEAIDNFEPERGVPFFAYARVLIKRRLIDYYRRQRSREALPLDQVEVGLAVEAALSLHDFREHEQNRERATEIKEYAQELGQWGLTFSDLVEVSPKHRDSRETLLRVARILALDEDLWQQVSEKGKVPMQALALRSGIHPKVLERGRKYILAVAILIAKQNDYIYLREYVLPPERGIRR